MAAVSESLTQSTQRLDEAHARYAFEHGCEYDEIMAWMASRRRCVSKSQESVVIGGTASGAITAADIPGMRSGQGG